MNKKVERKRTRSASRKRPAHTMTRMERKSAIVRELQPMKGKRVRNIEMMKDVYFTGKGIDEVAEKGKYSNKSMLVAMDAPNQARRAKGKRISKAKKNGKQQAMKLEKMITMGGRYKDVATKVNIGRTAKGVYKIYSVTVKKKKEVALTAAVSGLMSVQPLSGAKLQINSYIQ